MQDTSPWGMKYSSGYQIFSKHHKCKMHSQCSDACMLFLTYSKLWSKQTKAYKTPYPTIQCNFINYLQTLWSSICLSIFKAIEVLHKIHFIIKLFFYWNFYLNFVLFAITISHVTASYKSTGVWHYENSCRSISKQ